MAEVKVEMTIPSEEKYDAFVDAFKRKYKYEDNKHEGETEAEFANRCVYNHVVEVTNADIADQLEDAKQAQFATLKIEKV